MLCRPDCEICGGSGWFRVDVDLGHPFFGKQLECPNRPTRNSIAWKRSGLHEEEYGLDPSQMMSLGEIDQVRADVEEVLKRGWGFVYLWGDYGTGKTTFLKSIVAAWLRKQYDKPLDIPAYSKQLYHPTAKDVKQILHGYGGAAYLKTSKLIEVVTKAEFHPDRDNENHDVEYWLACQLLVLDEFDKVRDTPYAGEKRFWFMDERYESAMMGKSVTIMVGNVEPRDSMDKYIYDRLRDRRSTILWSGGASFRPIAGKEAGSVEE